MGVVRRQALCAAASEADVEFVFWTEPEKPHCAVVLQSITELGIPANQTLFFNRNSMSSYPKEQVCYYEFIRAVATSQLGFDFDYGFGPMLIHKSGLRQFVEYEGDYGDKWDAVLVPRLRLISSHLPFSVLPISFQNDKRLLQCEQGNARIIQKRLQQLNNVVPSMLSELTRLKRCVS